MFSFASNKPTKFGVYTEYAKDEIKELIALYETDLCEAAECLDADGLTRLAQALYLLKDDSFENIWWRIENRVHALVEENSLNSYHITNLLRSFSRSQNNK